MEYSEEDRGEAGKTGRLVSQKLLAIMDLQADVDALLSDKHRTPFGSKVGEFASLEAKQRMVAMVAVQFLLLEPDSLVRGNEELKAAGAKLIDMIIAQLKTLKTKRSDW